MVREAEEADSAEDAEYGKDRRGDEITDERLRDPKTRMARIRELRQKLEAEARGQHAERDDDDEPPTRRPTRRRHGDPSKIGGVAVARVLLR